MIIDDLPSYKPLFRSFFSGVAPQALLMENPGLQLPPLPPKAVDRRKFFRANFTKWWFQRRNMGDFTMVNQLEHCCFDILYSWYFSTFCWVGRTLFFPNVSPDLSFFAHWFSREFSPVWWVEHVFFFQWHVLAIRRGDLKRWMFYPDGTSPDTHTELFFLIFGDTLW